MLDASRIFKACGGMLCRTISASLIFIPIVIGLALPAAGQEAVLGNGGPAVAAVPIVPQQVRYAGKLSARAGDTVEAVFRIYATEQGGDPLWTETQRMSIAEDGSYSVLLGGASASGLPQMVFAGGAARWLGVSVERGQEQERVLLSSVPYAMKSADAELLAGHAASDFVTQEQLAQVAQSVAQPGQQGIAAPAITPLTSGAVTGSGTAGTVPLWTGTLTQGNSEITQVGSDVGINMAKPGATLDVGGSENVEGVLTLPAQATATTAAGYRSQLLDFSDSAWSTKTNAPVAQTWRFYATETGNNTANPTSNFNLQFQNGAGAATPIILSIGQTGVISFAPTQTFPGTVTSVAATSPVTATTTSGAVSLGLNASALETTLNAVYPQLGAANTFTKPITFAAGQTFPGTGVGAGKGLAYTDSVQFGETLLVDTTVVPLLTTSNSFNGTLTSVVNAPGTLGPILAVTNPGGGLNAAASVDFRTYLHSASAGTPSARIVAVDDNAYGNNLFFESKTDGSDANGLQTNVEIPSTGGLIALGKANAGGVGTAGITGFGGNSTGSNAGGAGIYGEGGNSPSGTGGDGGTFMGGSSNAGVGTLSSGGVGGVFQGGPAPNSGDGGDGIDVSVGEGGIYAGFFSGDVDVSGTLYAASKHFKIDHPLDPANKYLVHTSVESSEDMNIYTGNVVTDQYGNAVVKLPDWFQALNTDFRYQLTVIGQFAQAIVSKEVENNQFTISTNATFVKVSWQVTGIRQDAYAKANPLVVEQEKPANEQGFYIHPELYGQPAQKQTEWGRHPQMMQRLKARRQQATQPATQKAAVEENHAPQP